MRQILLCCGDHLGAAGNFSRAVDQRVIGQIGTAQRRIDNGGANRQGEQQTDGKTAGLAYPPAGIWGISGVWGIWCLLAQRQQAAVNIEAGGGIIRLTDPAGLIILIKCGAGQHQTVNLAA